VNKCILFAGEASQKMGKSIPLLDERIIEGQVEHKKFPSGEWYCQLKNNIRGADVYLLNAITTPANDSLMQLLVMADAARRSSAGRLTAIIPYMGYSRQDRKDKSRVPISAKLVMDLIQAAGFDRVVTMDLHAPQIAGFTNLPFDHLQFRPSLLTQIQRSGLKIDVVVAPDMGSVKRSEEYARFLETDIAIISKKRNNETSVEMQSFIGNVRGKNVLIVDDLTESAGTLVEAGKACKAKGAKKIFTAVTHGCYTDVGIKRLTEAFADGSITHMFESSTVETCPYPETFNGKLTRVDVAPVFAKAIHAIHNDESVSSLFI